VRCRGNQSQQDASQQPGHSRISGVRVYRKVAAAEQRSDCGESRVVKRVRQADPQVGGDGRVAGGSRGGHRVETRAQPAGNQIGRRRPEPRCQVVLLGILLGGRTRRRVPVDGGRRRRDRGGGLPMQHRSPLDTRAQPCHETLPAESLPGTVT